MKTTPLTDFTTFALRPRTLSHLHNSGFVFVLHSEANLGREIRCKKSTSVAYICLVEPFHDYVWFLLIYIYIYICMYTHIYIHFIASFRKQKHLMCIFLAVRVGKQKGCPWGAWVAQSVSVWRLISAQVMISGFMSLSPAQDLRWQLRACLGSSVSLSPCLSPAHALFLSK